MSHLPNFFLLGAPKSGTTTLYHALEKHTAVHLSTPKEPYYFEDEYAQGPEFYWRTYFATAWTGQPLIGDACTAHGAPVPALRAAAHLRYRPRRARFAPGQRAALYRSGSLRRSPRALPAVFSALATVHPVPRRLAARAALSRIGSRPAMSPQSRDWLREHYEPHNRRLEALVGRDLADWDR